MAQTPTKYELAIRLSESKVLGYSAEAFRDW